MARDTRTKLIVPSPERAVLWTGTARQMKIYAQSPDFVTHRPIGLYEFNRIFGKIPDEHLEFRENTTDIGRLCFDIYAYGKYEARQPSYYGSIGDKMPIAETMYKNKDGSLGYLADLDGAARLAMKRNGQKSIVGSHRGVEHSRYLAVMHKIELVKWRPFPKNIAEIECLDYVDAPDGKMWQNYLAENKYLSSQEMAYSSFARATYGAKIFEQNKWVWRITGKVVPFTKLEKERFLQNGGVFPISNQ